MTKNILGGHLETNRTYQQATLAQPCLSITGPDKLSFFKIDCNIGCEMLKLDFYITRNISGGSIRIHRIYENGMRSTMSADFGFHELSLIRMVCNIFDVLKC